MQKTDTAMKNGLEIRDLIHEIRGVRVILDRDIARLYGVTTGNLNKAVKRNLERFPERFMFQLTEEEFISFKKGQSSWGGTRTLPKAFTEQGVSMLSAVLRSPSAIQISISIIDAFVALRTMISDTQLLRGEVKELESRLEKLKMEQYENLTAMNNLSEDLRKEINRIYQAIAELSLKIEEHKQVPRNKIGFKRSDEN